MSRNNDVFQVLVTSGNQAVLAAGNKVTALAPGQVGVFSYENNLSLNATTIANVRNFYLAVGLDKDGDTVTDEIMKSAGSHVQKKNIVHYSYRPHTPGQPMKVVLSDYTADCETEYGIKLELRNQEIYRSQGYNQFTKTYSIVTSCCNGCEPTCPSGDANEITKLLKLQINNDPNGLVVAEAISRQAIVVEDSGDPDYNAEAVAAGITTDVAVGDVIDDATLEAFMTYNEGQSDPADYLYTDLEITTVTQKINAFCSVNLMYFYPRETVVIATKIEGFKCNGNLEVTQEAVFPEGQGYDIMWKEYIADGWKNSPYRLSTLAGMARPIGYNAVATQNYDQIALTYDQFSQGAWLEYYDNEASIIAIPATDTTTRDGLIAILDAAVTSQGFEALADDATAAVTSPTTVETTSGKDDVTKDGLA